MGMDAFLFSDRHIWVKKDGDNALLGLSDYAQSELRAVMFVNLPDVGEVLQIGGKFGDIESIKQVADLISPVSGEVIEVNESIIDEPYLINEAPYDSWLIRVGVSEMSDKLMDFDAYEKCKENL